MFQSLFIVIAWVSLIYVMLWYFSL